MSFDLHQWFQDLMDLKGDALCGVQIHGEREARTHIRVDYFFEADLDCPYTGPMTGLRPFARLSKFNVFELLGLGATLNKHLMRYYLARTLIKENPSGRPLRYKQIGLTILCVHKPSKFLKGPDFSFEEVTPWCYETTLMDTIPVTLICLRELQKVKGGEILAQLQLLEPDPQRRPKVWAHILTQNMTGREQLKNTMLRLDEEAYMTVYEEMQEEIKPKLAAEIRAEMRPKLREELRAEVEKEVKAEVEKVRDSMVLKLLRFGMDQEAIARAAEVDLDVILKLKASLT